MRELSRTSGGGGGGGTVVATTIAVFEQHHHLNGVSNGNRFDDSTDSDGTTRKQRYYSLATAAAKNKTCLENAAPDNLNQQYKRRNGRVATQHNVDDDDEQFESAVKDFNLVAEDVENSLRRQQGRGGSNSSAVKTTTTTTTVASGGENGRYVLVGGCDGCEYYQGSNALYGCYAIIVKVLLGIDWWRVLLLRKCYGATGFCGCRVFCILILHICDCKRFHVNLFYF